MLEFNWDLAQINYTPEFIRAIAVERGITEATVEGLLKHGFIGGVYVEKWKENAIAFPVHDDQGRIWRAHCRRLKSKEWTQVPDKNPDGRRTPALVYGKCETPKQIYVFESQWDAITLIDIFGLFPELDRGETCLISTRGANTWSRLTHFGVLWVLGAKVYVFPHNDDPGRGWLEKVIEITGGACVVQTPADHSDLGEWAKIGGATAFKIQSAIDAAEFKKPAAKPAGKPSENGDRPPEPYIPKGHSPVWFRKRGVIATDIVVGNGFLELGTAGLLASSSGVGKSSIAMQMGCCWSCGQVAFHLTVPRPLRIVMIQNEDSDNDLARQSAVIEHLNLDEQMVDENFWIETVRGKIGNESVKIMTDLVKWHRADLLLINPLSAYHEGDISQNKDNIKFLYGELGRLLDEKICAIFAFHHKTKPPKNNGKKPEDVYFEIMYDMLGGSTLTNFFRGLITVSAIGNSEVFKFALAKRFKESGWALKFEMFKWHEDRERYLWVPVGFAEGEKAAAGKTLEDLHKLVPVLGTIPKATLEMEASAAGFTRPVYRGLLAQALDESTPDAQRLHQWAIYNPEGPALAAIGRSVQPPGERPAVIKERRQAAEKAARTAEKVAKAVAKTGKTAGT